MSENPEAPKTPEAPESQAPAKRSNKKTILFMAVLGILGFTAVVSYGGFIKKDSKTGKTLIETYPENKNPGLEFLKYSISNAFSSDSGSSKKEAS
jgi:hypothetical protein